MPWRRRRTILGRGLTVKALCLIVLCVALAIGIAVIVSKSSSRDAPDSDAAVLPSQPQAFVLKYFWRKLHKKMVTMRIAIETSLAAYSPVTKQIERNKPEQDIRTTAVPRPHTVGPETKRTERSKPQHDEAARAAPRPHAVGPVTKRTEITTPKQDAVSTTATRPHAVGPVTKQNERTKPKQDIATTAVPRPHTVGPETERTERSKPQHDEAASAAPRPHAVGPVTKRTEITTPKQDAVSTTATRPHAVGPVTKQNERTKPKQDIAMTAVPRPHTVGPETERTERSKPQHDEAASAAPRPHAVGPVTKRTEMTTPKQDAVSTTATRPHAVGPVIKQNERTKPKQDIATTAVTRPHTVGLVTKRTERNKLQQDAVPKGPAPPDNIAITPKPKITPQFCETDTCRDLAMKIVDNMDRDANPCEDFYQYACGGFLNHTTIPDDREGVSVFSLAKDNLQMQLKLIMDTNDGAEEPNFFKLAKTLYNSCMKRRAINIKYMKGLISSLTLSSKRPTTNSSKTSYYKMIHEFKYLGFFVDYLIKAQVDVDAENNRAHVIYLDQPDLGLPRAFLTDKDQQVRDYYRQYIMAIGEILNLHRDDKNHVDAILTFETKLANISSQNEQLHDPQSKYRMTYRKFTETYPSLAHLLIHFQAEFSVDIDKDEVVLVRSQEYFAQLETLISSTQQRILLEYIKWRAIMDFSIYMNDEVMNETFAFKQHLTGVSASQPKWQECVDVVSNKLPLSAYTMYVEKYRGTNIRNAFEDILENYADAIAETLQMHDGTDGTVKRIAGMKKSTLLTKVMNPSGEEIDMFDKLYDWSTLSEDHYFGNSLAVTLVARKYMFDNLRKSVPKFDWVVPRDEILTKVRYSTSKNSIEVPIGLALPPFYEFEGSKHFNYGTLGFIMSREFAHAFDNSGRRYDQHGNITKVTNEKVDEEYKNLSNCIIEKYGNYSSKSGNLKANAVTMQNENFADMAGLKIAYSMYEKWIAKNGDEPKLPNMEEKPRQLFWISAAQTLCSKYKPQAEAFKIKTQAYFPDRFRVLGAVSNMPEFSNDFTCSAGSPMNPKEKCTLW